MVYHQREIRKCSKCARVFAYMMYIMGGISIFQSVIYFLFSEEMSYIKLPAIEGGIMYMQMDDVTMSLMNIINLVMSIIIVVQARKGL